MAINSNELNFLVYRYLYESGKERSCIYMFIDAFQIFLLIMLKDLNYEFKASSAVSNRLSSFGIYFQP